MSSIAPVLPRQITPAMLSFVAGEDIDLGQIVCLSLSDSNTVLLQDNIPPMSGTVLPAIGLSANEALAGEQIFVIIWGPARVGLALASVGTGDYIGTDLSISGPGVPTDLGAGVSNLTFVQNMSTVGVVIESDADGATVFVMPQIFVDTSGGGGVASFNGRVGAVVPQTGDYDTTEISGFRDAIVPTTFNTNADYDLPENPNPLASLQVFINSEAIPKPGQDRLLVQGVDYSLVAGTHGANARIHYLVTPTATNTIVCWYRV